MMLIRNQYTRQGPKPWLSRLKATFRKILKNDVPKVVEKLNSSPGVRLFVEKLAAGSILFMSLSVFVYGTLYIIPEVMKPFSTLWMVLIYTLSTWMFLGIMANMYLIHKRIRPIWHYELSQPPPVLKVLIAPRDKVEASDEDETTLKLRTEYSKAEPFGDESNWHYCSKCDLFVPPRAWHCDKCRTCILRRDHHCWFVGRCIGEENLCNFIGLLLYLSLGSTLGLNIGIVYALCIEKISFTWFMVRSILAIYFSFFDFDLRYVLAYFCTAGQCAAWAFLAYMIQLSMKAQTMADAHRKISRTNKNVKQGDVVSYNYKNMCEFLGPNPLIRIVWPFHRPCKKEYGDPVIQFEDKSQQAAESPVNV